ncbi:MAG: hypothetical protein AB7T07_13590 [Steroidobacteraceae bacterium]
MPWLFLAYPLLAHLATLIQSETLAWVALTVFFAVPLWPLLQRGKAGAWLGLLAITAALYACAASGFARYLMYVPPILIPLSVLWVFARSLRPGQIPMVTRVATQIRGVLPAELQQYTRRVTQGWVLLLMLMAGGSLLLAVFATPEFWSLMTNIVQYLLLGAVFLLEYLYRRWRFRHLPHETFSTLVTALFKTRMH